MRLSVVYKHVGRKQNKAGQVWRTSVERPISRNRLDDWSENYNATNLHILGLHNLL